MGRLGRGADAILLIAECLTTSELLDLMILARELQLTTLVETHDMENLLRVPGLGVIPAAQYATGAASSVASTTGTPSGTSTSVPTAVITPSTTSTVPPSTGSPATGTTWPPVMATELVRVRGVDVMLQWYH